MLDKTDIINRTGWTNRRKTSRSSLNVIGKIIITEKSKIYEEVIDIIDISYDGIRVVFANNDFLLKYLEFVEDKEGEIVIKFDFEDKEYSFSTKINWLKLYNIAEKDYYVLTALKYKNRDEKEEDILDLLTILQMRNIYLG